MLRKSLSLLGVIVVMAFIVGGCAHTNNVLNNPDTLNPEFGLSSDELGALTPEERAAIPMGIINAQYYPDAVVYETNHYDANPEYEQYDRENSRPLPNGGREVPTFMFSHESHTETIGDHVLINTENSASCIPDTDKCSRFTSRQVVVLRRQPIDRKWSGLNWSGHGSSSYSLLDITSTALNNLVVKLKYTRKTAAGSSSECNCLDSRGTVTWLDEPLREEIRRTLHRSGYVTYHAVRELEDELTQYQFALNGCYHADKTKERARLERGRQILAQFARFLD